MSGGMAPGTAPSKSASAATASWRPGASHIPAAAVHNTIVVRRGFVSARTSRAMASFGRDRAAAAAAATGVDMGSPCVYMPTEVGGARRREHPDRHERRREQIGEGHPDPHEATRQLLVLERRESQDRMRRMRVVDHATAEREEGGERVARQRREEEV